MRSVSRAELFAVVDVIKMPMARITISIPDDLHQRVRSVAAERRMSIAALVREAIEDKVAARRPKPKSFGVGASGFTDTARRSAIDLPVPRSWH